MNRLLLSVLVLLAAVFVLGRCVGAGGGPPANVRVEAAAPSDSTVRILWSAPAEGRPSAYLVYFQEVGSPSYTPLGETSDTAFVHNPEGGATGTYKVLARFGADTYDAADRPTTVPVENEPLVLVELDTDGEAGYGWDTSSGAGAGYSMLLAASAPSVDFYITDFDTGSAEPYSIASPDWGPRDPSGVVPTAAWRATGFTDVTPYEHRSLPSKDAHEYLDFQEINQPGMTIACHTEEGHYALLKVDSVIAGTGEVVVGSWFQLVPGLRLIKH